MICLSSSFVDHRDLTECGITDADIDDLKDCLDSIGREGITMV